MQEKVSEVYQKVIDDFAITGSVKQTARNVGTTLVRAQRILITEGLWSSKTSESVGKLYAENKTVPEIAKELFISEKTVQAYLPYVRTEKGYGGEHRSEEAIRSEDYRKRQQKALHNQVLNKESVEERKKSNVMLSQEKEVCDLEAVEVVSKEEILDMREKLDEECRSHKDYNNMTASDFYDSFMKKERTVLRLSLELKMERLSPEDKVVFNRYGKVLTGITRDILVPGDMTLHALHYVIQKAFGWQNSHLHSFKLSDDSFQKLTGGKNKTDKYGMINYDGKLVDWIKLCGIYFRYPTEDYEDLYWDDDYEEGISFKSWLKRKYTGPYRYRGEWEHYHQANFAARDFQKRFQTMEVKDFIHHSKPITDRLGAVDDREITIPVEEATIEDFQYGFTARLDELLERLPIVNLLVPKGIEVDDKIYAGIEELEKNQKDSMVELPTLPITDKLIYEYDYGDGWAVNITMTDCYYLKDSWDTMHEAGKDAYFIPAVKEKDVMADQRGYDKMDEYVEEEFSQKLVTVIFKKKPVCLAIDGLPVMDDVGGIYGYIDFLKRSRLSLPPERDDIREWAKSMGWNGRMSKPESLL